MGATFVATFLKLLYFGILWASKTALQPSLYMPHFALKGKVFLKRVFIFSQGTVPYGDY